MIDRPIEHPISQAVRGVIYQSEPLDRPSVHFPLTSDLADVMGVAADGVWTGEAGKYYRYADGDYRYQATAGAGRLGDLGAMLEDDVTNLAHNGAAMDSTADWVGFGSTIAAAAAGPDAGQTHSHTVTKTATSAVGVGVRWENVNSGSWRSAAALIYVPSSIKESAGQAHEVLFQSTGAGAPTASIDVEYYDKWVAYSGDVGELEVAGDKLKILVSPKTGNVEATKTVKIACVYIGTDAIVSSGTAELGIFPFPNTTDADLTLTGDALTLGTDALPTDPTADWTIAVEVVCNWHRTTGRILQANYTHNFILNHQGTGGSAGNLTFTYNTSTIGPGAGYYTDGERAKILLAHDASAGTITMWINGSQVAQETSVPAFTAGTPTKMTVGVKATANDNQIEGYIRNLRVWKGQALERWSQAY